ncbi:MAG TPA: DUF5667 domain-containing protein [Anaerolineales bacterium]
MKDQSELDAKIRERLEEIVPVPSRDPVVAYRARAQFMVKAVSASDARRHKGWITIFRKERFAMNMMISVLVIAGLLFGGGATVNAAQDDLPDEPLYALKMWSEDFSLQFRNDPERKVDRLMELAQIRIQEMTRLTDAGQAVPDQVRSRLELHIQQALQTCSSMDDARLDRTLLQLRDRLQQQDRDMERMQIHARQDAQPILERTRTMLRQRLQLVQAGLLDHEMFRYTVRNGFPHGQEDDATSPDQNENGPQNGQPTSLPGGANTDANGPNMNPGGPNTEIGGPSASMTPAPNNGGDGSGSGDGPGGNGSGGDGSDDSRTEGTDSGGDGTGGHGSGDNGSGGTHSGCEGTGSQGSGGKCP